MQSRKDQVQAYFFVVGRLAAAVVHGRPDALQPPNRRLTSGTVLGLLLGGIMAAIFGIVGIFVPGGDTSWRQSGSIVMDKDSGARYVYLDNQLRPVLNYSSARLAGGKSSTGQVISVAQKSLAGAPVGQPIGIPGAPDGIPAAGSLSTGTWTVCVQPPDGGQQGSPVVTLLLGQPGGQQLAANQAFLVSAPDGGKFLVWQGKRYRITKRSALESLGYAASPPVLVTSGWLNSVPQGPDLQAPPTPGVGQPGPMINGRTTLAGQIYQVRNTAIGSDQLYLVRQDGVVPVTPTAAALVLAAPETAKAYPGLPVEPIAVGPTAMTGLPQTSPSGQFGDGLPPQPPTIANPSVDSVPCMDFTADQNGAERVSGALRPAAEVEARAMPVASHVAGATADRIAVSAGGGALVQQQPTAASPPGAAFLITETGMKYPLANPDVVSALGYGGTAAQRVPPELLALVPAGPLLSIDAAVSPAGGAAQ
ncbi:MULTISPECIES: type VII secretion protein EccB [Amycolatopsis]|uniref:Type VII secretion protein EccB n=1 Tax=Amycolatopsis albidoflavus TaxID=102226 RepID=A0ABW5HRW5_9PSEU